MFFGDVRDEFAPLFAVAPGLVLVVCDGAEEGAGDAEEDAPVARGETEAWEAFDYSLATSCYSTTVFGSVIPIILNAAFCCGNGFGAAAPEAEALGAALSFAPPATPFAAFSAGDAAGLSDIL